MFKKVNCIHFVGIGGIGMSGIAELLMNLGFHITGSDINYSQNVKRLESIGIKISIGHDSENINRADVIQKIIVPYIPSTCATLLLPLPSSAVVAMSCTTVFKITEVLCVVDN